MDDDTIAFGDEMGPQRSGLLTHPYVTLFHVGFRAAAIGAYLFCSWFSDSFITSFVAVVLLLSADFWTVKNVTGRLMVGLRWWNYVDEATGRSHWVYESKNNQVNERESRIFWTALFLAPLVWGLFFLVALLSLKVKWMLLVLIALMLNCANLHGYIRCKVGTKASFGTITSDFLRKKVVDNAISIVTRPDSRPSNTNTV